jgi:plasmid stability protein
MRKGFADADQLRRSADSCYAVAIKRYQAFAGVLMASVLIRNVDDALHARLKASAAAHRRSLEEEARELLRAAVARQDAPPRESLAALARRLFGPDGGIDLDIPPRGAAPDSIPPDFSGPEHDPSS